MIMSKVDLKEAVCSGVERENKGLHWWACVGGLLFIRRVMQADHASGMDTRGTDEEENTPNLECAGNQRC